MFYYFVWVRSARYHGSEPLTYASKTKLAAGQIVQVELQREQVLGFVSGATTEPRFKTKLVTQVYDLPPLPQHLLRLVAWLQQYYPAPLGILAQQILVANLPASKLQAENLELQEPDLSKLPPLTDEQTAALNAMEERDTYVLHGKTGSGKTRLYMELAAKSIKEGRSAIILTPEISLTAQLASNMQSIFGNRVVVMHSNQAPAERRQAWLKCLHSYEPVIVIGPRSALFSPLKKPGLIVLDESHEAAYKQEQAPQYQTGRVASYLALITRSSLVFGSATPLVTDYFLAEQKDKPIVTLRELAQKGEHPPIEVTIIDRKEHDLFSRSPFMSLPLIKAVEGSLNRGEQSLLYLNRRGTARLVLCENCGWQATCPRDDIPLTYHGDKHELRCHSCDHKAKAPVTCPSCGHPNILYKTAGTKAIVEEVQRLFPDARVARFDTDNAKADRFEQHYDKIRNGEVDILVGTQLLAKGLDLPKLGTLGILLADTSLYMPDYTAHERTFQLISQVLGRIGRGHIAGRAIIQTYHPDNAVLQQAIDGDYQSFYKTELAARKQFLFPPFCYLLKLNIRRASIKAAESAAAKLKSEIESSGRKVRIEGPAPSFYERFQNKYQWQLVIKSKDREELLKIISDLPANVSYDIDPVDLL